MASLRLARANARRRVRIVVEELRMRCAVIALSAVVLLAGCAAQRDGHAQNFKLIDHLPLAVVPFDNLSANPNAGLIVTELMRAELLAHEINQQVPPEQVAAKLRPLAGEARTPQQLGELLGAKTLLLGTVTEFAYKRGLGEDPVIGISLRVVDATSGQVLWSGARSAVGDRWFIEDGLSRLAQDACRRLADTIPE